ncbi:hypothetical protein B0H14DRAFT_2618580 [Mycena olivaceomarginata]|nr:hypothetical protein B0H14DRAFT_2618580 [Mycena olivaceomarginata]
MTKAPTAHRRRSCCSQHPDGNVLGDLARVAPQRAVCHTSALSALRSTAGISGNTRLVIPRQFPTSNSRYLEIDNVYPPNQLAQSTPAAIAGPSRIPMDSASSPLRGGGGSGSREDKYLRKLIDGEGILVEVWNGLVENVRNAEFYFLNDSLFAANVPSVQFSRRDDENGNSYALEHRKSKDLFPSRILIQELDGTLPHNFGQL